MLRTRYAVLAAVLIALAYARPVNAQGTYTSSCAVQAVGRPQLRAFCERVGQGVDIALPRIGVSATGGNPVPGTASTLGMRLRSVPRVSFDVRATSAFVDLPNIATEQGGNDLKYASTSIDVDASVGVFSGLSVFPTIGGFGSIDALASAGIVKLPGGKGFTGSPKTWGVGARVGILRESFTAPGISLSAMYRRIGGVTYGDSTFSTGFSSFSIRDNSLMSYRAAISKRIPLVGLGLTGGAGIDRYTAGSAIRGYEPGFNGFGFNLASDETKTTRKSAFVNASWTMLLLNISGELGWQQGGKADAAATIPADRMKKAGYYAGVALRLAL